MLTAFLAPEFVVAWATWQFLNARQVAKAFNENFGLQRAQPRGYCRTMRQKLVNMLLGGSTSLDDGWTETHGFFAWMGGFVLHVDSERRTLTPKELLDFVQAGSVEIPAITEADIKDRSKSDLLSKWVAIIQLVWFVIQLIARYIQNLPVTLLEIDTLGVAALTCISYGFWLNKPKDVRFPHIVHWKDPTAPPPPGSLDSDKEHGTLSILRLLFNYRTQRSGGLTREKIMVIIGCISGMAFGAIHCLGWNFLFPRHAEQILCRVASIGIPYVFSGILQVPILLHFLERLLPSESIDGQTSERLPLESIDGQTSERLPPALVDGQTSEGLPSQSIYIYNQMLLLLDIPQVVPISSHIMFLYIPARISIIVLMFLSLRSLPPGTYDTVAWTEFIPHVNL
ncbi:uncharacterized protein BJ212DRAFT_348473 [Suillus subaureus]|uniref:Uncharacterized protein n=1 Tax=Suillus subaureus TaxID=48587 RepID=A0A9P7E915_9AGAM|nr:uncharacterized protein BJ212DRAFT_348473 [Suillus subaureus]KAG1814710.1 hypothetical protein BJ212DRAFT_348473 [Suillus subaureus]